MESHLLRGRVISRDEMKRHELSSEQLLRVRECFNKVRLVLGDKTPIDFTRVEGRGEEGRVESASLRKIIRSSKGDFVTDFVSPDIYSMYDDQYFYQNLMKALVLIEVVSSDDGYSKFIFEWARRGVVDIGCGTGVFTIAICAMLHIRELPMPEKLYLLDHGDFQLNVAHRILNKIFDFDVGRISLIREDFLGVEIQGDGLHLASYVMPSSGMDPGKLTQSGMSNIIGPALLFLDYGNNVQEFALYARAQGFAALEFARSVVVDDLIEYVKTTKVNVNGLFSWRL